MWVQTGAYHLTGLYWLIALVVVFVLALIALSVAGRALARAKRASGAGGATYRGAVPGAPGIAEDQKLPESFRMLDERYAKGEISREEYMQRQTDIQSKV